MRLLLSLLMVLSVTAAPAGFAGDVATGDTNKQNALEGVSVEDLVWMTGYWQSDDRGVLNEECWLAPGGSVMLGLHRDTFDDGRMKFEYLRIMDTADGVVYYASPQGFETTKFRLTAYSDKDGARQAVFENPDHNFPRTIRYTLNGGILTAEVEGLDDGQNVVAVWTWTRSTFPE
jgi:hypothetical protein